MSILTILEFPDERLRKKAVPVKAVDAGIRKLVADMFETMYESHGVGLAATQVNVHQRIIVMDVSEDKKSPLCLINPEIIEKDGIEETEEGCLSVPGFFEKVKRAEHVKVSALNQEGKTFEIEARELMAVCVQHEMDHLEGVLFVDHISKIKRDLILRKLTKLKKQMAKEKARSRPGSRQTVSTPS